MVLFGFLALWALHTLMQLPWTGIFFCLLGLGACCLATIQLASSPLQPWEDRPATYTAQVQSAEAPGEKGTSLICQITSIQGTPLPEPLPQVLLFCPASFAPDSLPLGASIQFQATLQAPSPPRNPRGFDQQKYLYSRSIACRGTASQLRQLPGEAPLWLSWQQAMVSLRESFLDALALPEASRTFLSSLLFGIKEDLNPDVQAAFQGVGTAHILAVSGLHIGMVYGLYAWLRNRLQSRWVTILFLFLLFVYGTCCLWAVPVTRATLLILLRMVAKALDRPFDLVTGAAAIALVFLIWQPYLLFSIGFQLSFLAVLAMDFFRPLWTRRFTPAMGTLLSVQLALLPYLTWRFHLLPLLTGLANLLLLPLAGLLVPAGIAAFFLVTLLPALSGLAGGLLHALSQALLWLTQTLYQDGQFTLLLCGPPFPVLVGLLSASFFLASELHQVLRLRQSFSRKGAGLLLLLLITEGAFFWDATPLDEASVIFLDVGQGDAIHLQWESDLLIDSGGSASYNVGEQVLRPYFLSNGIRQLDGALLTHSHTDHALGLAQLSQTFPVAQVLSTAYAGDRIVLSQDRWIDVLWPFPGQEEDPEDENATSRIYKIWDHGGTVLVTGDITQEGEVALLDAYRESDALDCDVLKVAHHGSRYSSSPAFLSAVSPDLAIVSVGASNPYGHPALETLERLETAGAAVYRTDEKGAIGLIRREDSWEVVTMLP